MSQRHWSERVSPEAVKLRAGGRRRYNAARQAAADERRKQVLSAMRELAVTSIPRAKYAGIIAARLGVGIRMIQRDIKALKRPAGPKGIPDAAETYKSRCPLCGHETVIERVRVGR